MSGSARPSDAILDLAEIARRPLPSNRELRDCVREETLLGTGGNASVYSVPGHPDLAFRVPLRWQDDGKSLLPSGDEQPRRIEDHSFEGRNFGQPLAVFTAGSSILYLQSGVPVGIPHHLKKITSDAAMASRDAAYEASTFAVADMPPAAFTALLEDFRFLNDRGKCVDTSKANNMLYDVESRSFKFVDVQTTEGDYRNSPDEAVVMLFDNASAGYYQGTRTSEMVTARRQILDKVLTACESNGIAFLAKSHPHAFHQRGESLQGSSLRFSLTLAGYQDGTPEREAIERRILLTSMPGAEADRAIETARQEREQDARRAVAAKADRLPAASSVW